MNSMLRPRKIQFALRLLIAAIGLFAARPAASADFILGIGGPGLDDRSMLDSLGWGWARVPLRWNQAKSGGTMDWASVERQISAASAAGMKIQLTISFGWGPGTNPPFAVSPATGLPADDAGRAAMQSFLQEAFSRFGSRVDAIGVEDDLSARSFPGGPTVYAQLLKYVSDSTHSVLPGKPIVFGPINFNTMEEDQRVFFISDTIRALKTDSVFDAIELRLPGTNATSDYRRIVGAYNHLAGQVEGTPYQNVNLHLVTSSPARGDSEQASDLVRRAFLAAERGFHGMTWDALVDRDGANHGLASSTGRRRAFSSAFAVGRMAGRFDLSKTKVIPRSRNMSQLELAYKGGGTTTMVWRDYFASGQEYSAWENVELKAFDIEGPYRVGLMALPLVPQSDGILHGSAISGKTFDLGGAPVVLSKNYEMLREIGGVVQKPEPTPNPAAARPEKTPEPNDSFWAERSPRGSGGTRLVAPNEF